MFGHFRIYNMVSRVKKHELSMLNCILNSNLFQAAVVCSGMYSLTCRHSLDISSSIDIFKHCHSMSINHITNIDIYICLHPSETSTMEKFLK